MSPPPPLPPDPPLPPAHAAPLPRAVKLLGWASFLNDVASEMIYTQLPHFLIYVLGGSTLYLGIIEGTGDAISSLLKFWSGIRSDRGASRWKFIAGGYWLASISRPLISLATMPWHLLTLRILDRVGKGVRTSPRDAMIADKTDETNRGRAFGFHRGMDHFGAAIGPLLATAFLVYWPDQIRTLFLLSLAPGLVVLVLMMFLRDKRRTGPAPSPVPIVSGPLPRNFRLFLAAMFLFTLGNSSDMFLLVRAGELGMPTAFLPLLWCLFHVVKSVGNMTAGRWVDRFGPKRILAAGWLVYAVVYFLFAFATGAFDTWILFALYALYYALAEPAEKTLVAQLADSQRRGQFYGLFHLVVGLAALPASILFGWIYYQFGGTVAFGLGSGMAIAGLGVLVMGVHRSTGERHAVTPNAMP